MIISAGIITKVERDSHGRATSAQMQHRLAGLITIKQGEHTIAKLWDMGFTLPDAHDLGKDR